MQNIGHLISFKLRIKRFCIITIEKDIQVRIRSKLGTIYNTDIQYINYNDYMNNKGKKQEILRNI